MCQPQTSARSSRSCGFRPPAVAPARRFEIAVTTFQRRYLASGQHIDIRLRLDALDKVIGHSRLQTSATGQQPYLLYVTRSHVDLEFAAAQLVLEMLAQRLLVDLELLGAVSLSEAESRSVLGERALVCGRHIFGWYFPFRVAQLRDARARGGKLSECANHLWRPPPNEPAGC